MRVGYLGPAGTHSEEALRTSSPEGAVAVPYPTIYDAVMAVEEGAVERAVVPIENALEGSVGITLDTLALDAGGVRIAAEVVHPIHHCVIARGELVRPGTETSPRRLRRPTRSLRSAAPTTRASRSGRGSPPSSTTATWSRRTWRTIRTT